MKYTPTPCPTHSPWGGIQTRDHVAPGLWFVSTASHGGLHMSPERLKHFRNLFPAFEGYAGLPWLEEDCDYCMAVIAFPEDFSAEAVFYAVDMILTYDHKVAPLNTEPTYFAVGLAYLNSPVGAAVKKTHADYAATRVGLWRRGGCGTSGKGWQTLWSRDLPSLPGAAPSEAREHATTFTEDYVTQNWMTDAEIAARQPKPVVRSLPGVASERSPVPALPFDFDESQCSGVFDGHQVVSDADSGL